jgi:hypothetical protein
VPDFVTTIDASVGIDYTKNLYESHCPIPIADKRDRPAITTHNQGNHAIRSERYRYMRYADGSEGLYDMPADPNEWINLAGDVKFVSVVEEHRKWLPKVDVPAAPNTRHRVLKKGRTGNGCGKGR